MKHSRTVNHIDNVTFQIREKINNNKVIDTHKDKIKRAEIKLAAFFAEHNVAFSTADHLILLLKGICINSKIVQDFTLVQHKCKNITRVIIKYEIQKLVEYLRIRKFSILIDESTIRYFQHKNDVHSRSICITG